MILLEELMHRVLWLALFVAACDDGSKTKTPTDLAVTSSLDLSVSSPSDLAVLPDSSSPSDGPSADGAMGPTVLLTYDSNRNLDGTDSVSSPPVYHVWAVSSDGTNTALTPMSLGNAEAYNATWSPDGSKVLFESARALDGSNATTNNAANVWVMNADGSSPKPLTKLTTTGADCDYPVWSPDGTKIAFQSKRNLNGTDSAGNAINVWVMGADGTSPTALTQLTATSVQCLNPIWSPDGSTIAYTGSRAVNHSDAPNANGSSNVWTIKPNGTSDQPVTSYTANGAYATTPSWSFDSKKLAFASSGKLDGSNTQIASMNIWATVLSPSPTPFPLTQMNTVNLLAQNPVWSPVADKVSFQSNVDPNGGGGPNNNINNIWIINGDGTALTSLTKLAAVSMVIPIWSKDGTRIASLSQRKFDGSDAVIMPSPYLNVWIMNADGSSPKPLTRLTTTNTGDVDWHP
jgi:Tol biopolymer transport system component